MSSAETTATGKTQVTVYRGKHTRAGNPRCFCGRSVESDNPKTEGKCVLDDLGQCDWCDDTIGDCMKHRPKHEVKNLLPKISAEEASANPGQILNPPFVLSLASGDPDDALGVALGNGAIVAIPGDQKWRKGVAPWA